METMQQTATQSTKTTPHTGDKTMMNASVSRWIFNWISNCIKSPQTRMFVRSLKSAAGKSLFTVGVIALMNFVFFGELYKHSSARVIIGFFIALFIAKVGINHFLNKRGCSYLSAAILTVALVAGAESLLSFGIQTNQNQKVAHAEATLQIETEGNRLRTALNEAVVGHNQIVDGLRGKSAAIVSAACPNPSLEKTKKGRERVQKARDLERGKVNAVIAGIKNLSINEQIGMLDTELLLSNLGCAQAYMASETAAINAKRHQMIELQKALQSNEQQRIHHESTVSEVKVRAMAALTKFWLDNSTILIAIIAVSVGLDWLLVGFTRKSQYAYAAQDSAFPRAEMVSCLLPRKIQFRRKSPVQWYVKPIRGLLLFDFMIPDFLRTEQEKVQRYFRANIFVKLHHEKNQAVIDELAKPLSALNKYLEAYNDKDLEMVLKTGLMRDEDFATHMLLVYRIKPWHRLFYFGSNVIDSHLSYSDKKPKLIDDVIELDEEKAVDEGKESSKPNWLLWASGVGAVFLMLILFS